MIANEKCNLPSAFGKRYQMNMLLPAPPATKLKSVIPLESRHLWATGPTTFFPCMAWSQLLEVGEHMLVDQIRLRV